MNYFDMLPDELQEIILGFKKQREEKAVRLKKLKTDMDSLNVQLNSEKLTLQKLSRVLVAIGLVNAWVQLECAYYGNPKEELGSVGYSLMVSKLTKK